jgi:hypothetical protein
LQVSPEFGSDLCPRGSDESSASNPPASQRAFSVSEYGREFDDEAKERMIIGCRQISHLLEKYASRIRGAGIEFGPFKNPLLLPEAFPDCAITYVDGDIDVAQHLRSRFRANPSVQVVSADLNDSPARLTRRLPQNADVIIASQVLNYVDMRRFFTMVSQVAAPHALLFVNNVPHYGIPELFSENRPRNNKQVVSALQERGWTILEENHIAPQFVQQKDERLILVAQAPEKRVSRSHHGRHVQQVQVFVEQAEHDAAECATRGS